MGLILVAVLVAGGQHCIDRVAGVAQRQSAGADVMEAELVAALELPTSGRIRLNGEDVTGRPPHELARRGLVRTFQHTTVFSRLPAS